MKCKLIAACALSLLTQACVGFPGAGISSSTDIARDAAALNDAYGRAMSDQILLNVLRARDRWPRQYVNLTGIINQPTLNYSAGLSLSPLPFNNAAGPFRGSSLGPLSRSQQSAYNYGITPLTAGDVNSVLLTPITRTVFRRYWEETGWPHDILLLVMVKSAERYQGPTKSRVDRRVTDEIVSQLMRDDDDPHHWGRLISNWYTSDDAGGGEVCTAGAAPPTTWQNGDEPPNDRCAFFGLAHRFAAAAVQEADGHDAITVHLRPGPESCADVDEHFGVSVTTGNADLMNALNNTVEQSGGRMRARLQSHAVASPALTATQRRAGVGRRARNQAPQQSLVLQNCVTEPNAPILMEVRNSDGVVQATYRLKMRSIDDMIYSLGTLLRPVNEHERAPPRRRLISMRCPEGYCVSAPLFTVREGEGGDPRQFAARVDYQGHRYLAGPAVGDPRQGQSDGDQTASVITLLSQLFTLNVQASTTPPPQRVNTN